MREGLVIKMWFKWRPCSKSIAGVMNVTEREHYNLVQMVSKQANKQVKARCQIYCGLRKCMHYDDNNSSIIPGP